MGHSGWRRLARGALAAAAVLLEASIPAAPAGAAPAFVVVQMNLCNSGLAIHSCYSFGRAIDEAVGRIRRYAPDLVTLQEVCHDDLFAPDGWGKLAQAMADRYGSGHIRVDFSPAINRNTDNWYRCTDGAQYGIAMIYHGDHGDAHQGWYANQDASEEVRTWTCDTLIPGRLTGCTTHLSTDGRVAIRQCHEMISILASSWVMPDVIVAGDFNLHALGDCASRGYATRDDRAVQQVVFTRDIRWVWGGYEGMRWTDHPLLYERFQI